MDSLSDYAFIKEDTNAKSLSFFCEGDISYLDNKILDCLKKIAFEKKENLRISLHSTPKSTLHNMIIFQHKGTYNRPHYHKNKAETYHIIEGTQAVFVFDENGEFLDRCDMSGDGAVLYRFEEGYFHMSVPTSEYVIFHESKVGPFVREGDSIFAEWAPAIESYAEIEKFISDIMKK